MRFLFHVLRTLYDCWNTIKNEKKSGEHFYLYVPSSIPYILKLRRLFFFFSLWKNGPSCLGVVRFRVLPCYRSIHILRGCTSVRAFVSLLDVASSRTETVSIGTFPQEISPTTWDVSFSMELYLSRYSR